jgi:hypothetical protein
VRLREIDPEGTRTGGSQVSVDLLLSRLAGARKTRSNCWVARCPSHEDRSPSLSVRELADGRVLVHCFAGCDAGAIMAAVGLELDALFPPRPSDDGRRPRERNPFSPHDALRLIDREVQRAALLIVVTAKHPEQLTAERCTQLMRCANLIRRARHTCGLSEV